MSDQSGGIPPLTIRREEYAPPAYWIDRTELHVDIGTASVTVHATLSIRPNATTSADTPLVLDGESLTTSQVRLDGVDLPPADYRIDGNRLTLKSPPQRPFCLETTVEIDPWSNTSLSGLYKSGDLLCTQCEAEGFRRITWYLDRPDVMSAFLVTIEADETTKPVLLSNGNLVLAEKLGGGRHRTVWEDPFPKPSYLFALVAGDLALVQGTFKTHSGRDVSLRFWVEHGNEDQVPHALVSLQKSMAWDEQIFGLEYDLDVFNVVAVSHFNMGAMENKSLNIFNSKYVLAKRETATDTDFMDIESVIAHEYFHNWTGNRVTCRDWFQLTLKEGLTVFRDQEFSGDMNSRAIQRIEDARGLRAGQFPEDNSPMAHPIRPDTYVEINNFYTATVYSKGAEVIRMIHTLIGPSAFRKGMDLYFARHDGQAVTCEDFVAAMEDASGRSLTQFRLWYSQAGTPRISAAWTHDAPNGTLTLTLKQTIPPTPGQATKSPMHIPVGVGLIGPDGGDIVLRLKDEAKPQDECTSRILDFTQSEQSFVFVDVPQTAIPSLFRNFSAPVLLDASYEDAELATLMSADSDSFNRWEAGQILATKSMLAQVDDQANKRPLTLNPHYAEAWAKVLTNAAKDPAFAAEALVTPGITTLGEHLTVFDVDGLYQARKFTYTQLVTANADQILALRDSLIDKEWSLDQAAIARRGLRNTLLALLAIAKHPETKDIAQAQFDASTCMTDQLTALSALIELGENAAGPALQAFYKQWSKEGLVVNKWLGLQAVADWDTVQIKVNALTEHPAFDWSEPNKIYALIGGFAGNIKHFHSADGAGYRFLGEQVIRLNATNPQVAARLVRPLIRWRRYDVTRQGLMRTQLEAIRATPALSRDVGEIVNKALES